MIVYNVKAVGISIYFYEQYIAWFAVSYKGKGANLVCRLQRLSGQKSVLVLTPPLAFFLASRLLAWM